MTYVEFLTAAIDDGVRVADANYTEDNNHEKLRGTVAGLDACRTRTPRQLKALLDEAMFITARKRVGRSDDALFWLYREAGITWVCDCVSAILVWREHVQPLIPMLPTDTGTQRAGKILGGWITGRRVDGVESASAD